jgi:hypothetical protein
VILVDVTADDERPEICPGATVARLPALTEANISVPAEYVTHWTTPHWYGDNPSDPFDVRMFEENVTGPELAFISSQEKPDPRFAVEAEIKMGWLQTMMALLCVAPLSAVLTLNSITGRVQEGNFPAIQGQRALKVWRSILLLACATQKVSLSDAAAAGETSSMVKPSRKFA